MLIHQPRQSFLAWEGFASVGSAPPCSDSFFILSFSPLSPQTAPVKRDFSLQWCFKWLSKAEGTRRAGDSPFHAYLSWCSKLHLLSLPSVLSQISSRASRHLPSHIIDRPWESVTTAFVFAASFPKFSCQRGLSHLISMLY